MQIYKENIKMKKKEIKKLTREQSIKEYEKLKKDLFNIRFQKINGQVKNPSKINETKNMKNKEIKKFTNDELTTKINSLKKDLFNIRFRKVNGQIESTAKFSEIRKNVARMLTALKKKK